ncbi:Hypothetical protein PBC10988_19530 [Planctomycetales bacterium 10988]|nr:Hypothetical protein PBC10988_19530 [Planctomycetales bacterium 10988]
MSINIRQAALWKKGLRLAAAPALALVFASSAVFAQQAPNSAEGPTSPGSQAPSSESSDSSEAPQPSSNAAESAQEEQAEPQPQTQQQSEEQQEQLEEQQEEAQEQAEDRAEQQEEQAEDLEEQREEQAEERQERMEEQRDEAEDRAEDEAEMREERAEDREDAREDAQESSQYNSDRESSSAQSEENASRNELERMRNQEDRNNPVAAQVNLPDREQTQVEIQLQDRVRQEFRTANFIQQRNSIDIRVYDDRVYLIGEVKDPRVKMRAKKLARSIEGITVVENHIHVVYADGPVSDEELRRRVIEALVDERSREINIDRLKIEVEDRVVYIEGEVYDRREHQLIENITEDVPGVEDVRLKLFLASY